MTISNLDNYNLCSEFSRYIFTVGTTGIDAAPSTLAHFLREKINPDPDLLETCFRKFAFRPETLDQFLMQFHTPGKSACATVATYLAALTLHTHVLFTDIYCLDEYHAFVQDDRKMRGLAEDSAEMCQ